ncbi:MAG TPA: glycosyltransferase, partial [Ferruginibacter sp.]|nr:glycosyltransferase [Ferruginibacter sp.]
MKPRLIRISTVPMALRILLTGQPRYMREHGMDVWLLSADDKERQEVMELEGCEHIIVPMTRKITPWQDFRCLLLLRRLFKKIKPDIVHTHTPKAGLLGMLAARSLGIPVRIHTVAGLPLMVEKGLKRKILLLTERLTYWGATQVWPNSPSMLAFIREQGLCPEQKLAMINNGSTNGVDTTQFNFQRWLNRSDNPALHGKIKPLPPFK